MFVSRQHLPACEARRPACETCADDGQVVNWVLVWSQADEQGGWLDSVADGWKPCPDCQPQTQEEATPDWYSEAAA